jgi:hypothetical protein
MQAFAKSWHRRCPSLSAKTLSFRWPSRCTLSRWGRAPVVPYLALAQAGVVENDVIGRAMRPCDCQIRETVGIDFT